MFLYQDLLPPTVRRLPERIGNKVRNEGLSGFISLTVHRGIWRVAWKILAPTLAIRFKEESRDAETIKEAIDLAQSFRFLGVSVAPYQVREEIEELLTRAAVLKPKTILEIGTASGGTLFLFTRIAPDDAKVISVDLPQGEFGGGYPAWKSLLFKSFAKDRQEIHLIRASSHDPGTLESVSTILGDRYVDILFIDGDHSYEGVREDFEMYSPLVREGGIIAFHDVWPGNPEEVGGVPAFWKEVVLNHKGTLLISNSSQRGCGIGVLTQ